MEYKQFKLQIKEFSEDGSGGFRGYLSVFNNIDRGGDVVMPGAFKKTLSENKAFHLLWAHDSVNQGNWVGTFRGAEDKHGLDISSDFFMDIAGVKDLRAKLKTAYERGAKVGLSIGYETIAAEDGVIDGKSVRYLKEIKLYEGSLTLFPMNERALVEDVKQALDDTMKPKTVKVVCGACGETVMEITDPEDKALDAVEPDAKSTPENEPPEAEAPANRAVREFVESARASITKLIN